MDLEEKLQQGIDAARANDKKAARAILKEVVEADETQAAAWLWLYKVVDSLEEKAICLDNVLTLEPDNDYARERLIRIKSEQKKLVDSPYGPGEEEPPPAVVNFSAINDAPVTTDYPHKDEFDNELLCPYCVALTHRQDRVCPTCHRPLIISRRVKEERTVWLWRAVFLQFVVGFFLPAFGAAYATLAGKLHGIPTPMPFFPLYFGQPVDQPERAVQMMLAVFPVWVFWGLIAASFYSLILMVLLYVRIPYGNVVYLVNATLLLGLGVVGIIFFFSSYVWLGAGVFALFLGAAQMVITLNLWNDFTFKEGRLLLRIDHGVKGHRSLAISGRKYSQLGIWGLAIIHLRRAVLREPANPANHVGLVVAYMKINRYDLAEKALQYAGTLPFYSAELNLLRDELNNLRQSSR